MEAITYTAAREELASTMDRVCQDHTPILITRNRNRNQSVVMISLEDYESMEETAYLLSTPANAKRLAESLEQARKGKVVVREINVDE